MSTLKETIKTLAAGQKELKNQRKTVNLVGERTMSSFAAYCQHANTRVSLHTFYVAYAILRGKDPLKADQKYGEDPYFVKAVQKQVEKYAAEFEAVRAGE